jgi:hypothetical protein
MGIVRNSNSVRAAEYGEAQTLEQNAAKEGRWQDTFTAIQAGALTFFNTALSYVFLGSFILDPIDKNPNKYNEVLSSVSPFRAIKAFNQYFGSKKVKPATFQEQEGGFVDIVLHDSKGNLNPRLVPIWDKIKDTLTEADILQFERSQRSGAPDVETIIMVPQNLLKQEVPQSHHDTPAQSPKKTWKGFYQQDKLAAINIIAYTAMLGASVYAGLTTYFRLRSERKEMAEAKKLFASKQSHEPVQNVSTPIPAPEIESPSNPAVINQKAAPAASTEAPSQAQGEQPGKWTESTPQKELSPQEMKRAPLQNTPPPSPGI